MHTGILYLIKREKASSIVSNLNYPALQANKLKIKKCNRYNHNMRFLYAFLD
ncbi:hypothetical protein EsVE80_21080 [Enterococcus saigonensis]|uniref:Uncharacterized protein n=1 Tax=Enterococcus saigonensis TaxID=1805431 RepID=A0A679IM32_9ENTE|nr:hypothetical protein EsVE80_21080 [Enterococcus saigonensis]